MCYMIVEYVEFSVCGHRYETRRQKVSFILLSPPFFCEYEYNSYVYKIDCNRPICSLSQEHTAGPHNCAAECIQK